MVQLDVKNIADKADMIMNDLICTASAIRTAVCS